MISRARKLHNFHPNHTQEIILSQFNNHFKVIQLPRKRGNTTALFLGAILRLEDGLDTNIVTESPDSASWALINLARLISDGEFILDAHFQIKLGNAKVTLLDKYSGESTYTLFDTPFSECETQCAGIALDCYGLWNISGRDFVRVTKGEHNETP